MEKIGTGKFSTVHVVRNKMSGKLFAAKVIDKPRLQPEEAEILRQAKQQRNNHHARAEPPQLDPLVRKLRDA